MSIIAALVGVTAWRLDAWWTLLLWPTAAASALFGGVGLGTSVPRAERDEEGRRLEPTGPVRVAGRPEACRSAQTLAGVDDVETSQG